MSRFSYMLATAMLFLLAACGAGSGGGGVASGTTQVTIPFAGSGNTTVAGGALTTQTQTTAPAAVQSMTVTAQSGGTVLATASASRPNLVATMNLANATGVTFLVQAYDVYGTQIYQGQSGATNLNGTPVTVGVTEQVVLGGVAATGLPVANATLTITDAAGATLTMTTDAAGNYQKVLPTNLVYPLLIESTQPNGTVIAAMMTRLGKVHTNTFSTLAVTKALGVASYSQIAGGFTTFTNTYANATTPASAIIQSLDDDMTRSAQQVMQQLGLTKFTKLGKADPLHDAGFVANGTGLDGVMDSVRMEERDVDGDGKGDLVLAGRGATGTPILSVRSTTKGLNREAGTLALSGAAVAGDDLGNGVPLTESDSVVIDAYGLSNTVSTGATPAAIGITKQDFNHLVSAVLDGFDEAGVSLVDPYNQTVMQTFVSQLISQLQTTQTLGTSSLTESFFSGVASSVTSSLRPAVATNGKIAPTIDVGSAVLSSSSSVTPQKFSDFPVKSLGVLVSDVGTGNTIGASNTSRNIVVTPQGKIHAVFQGSSGIRVASSSDGGVSFTPSVSVYTAASVVEPEIAVNAAGDVFVAWMDQYTVYVSRSVDGGATFSSPVSAGTVRLPATIHMAVDGSDIYIVSRFASVVFVSHDGGMTFSSVTIGGAEVFADIQVDPISKNVIVQADNPSLSYWVSTDKGATFGTVVHPNGAIYYSTSALSVGSLGRFLYVSGYGTAAYRINVDSYTATPFSVGNSVPFQGRSLVADNQGLLVTSYSDGISVFFAVSADYGQSFFPEVKVATNASISSVTINPVDGSILVLYENAGKIFLNTYTPLISTTAITLSPSSQTNASWQSLSMGGSPTTASTKFASALTASPTNAEAGVGLCVTGFANLMTDPSLLPLLKSMTSDNGATLPTPSVVAMSIANNSALAKVNWLSRMAITGTQVQSFAFLPVVGQISSCITTLESVKAAGFTSQTITSPAVALGGASSIVVDTDDLDMLLAELYGLRSQIYWLDAYNWDTDVDGDGTTDTLPVTYTDTTGTYQYYTISTDPYAVFNDPSFFTFRASGAIKGSGAQDISAALADAQIAAAKAHTVLLNFSSNTTRGLDGNHLFSFGSINKLSQNLTDAANADNALNGTGYTANFSQPGASPASGTVRADLIYPVFDRSKLPQLTYDVTPDPVASKKNDSPTFYDDGAGNVVRSSIYFGTYPDPTLGGGLTGGAALDKRERKTRPNKTLVLTLNGVPVKRWQNTASGWEDWPGGIMTDANGNLFALQTIFDSATTTTTYTVYSVNASTGALTAVAGKSGTLTGSVQGSGTSVGSNFFVSGWSGGQYGFWNLGIGSLVPVVRPLNTSICSADVLRPDGTGLAHWYYSYPLNGSYKALTSTTNNGNLTIREQYPGTAFNDFNAVPLGLDSALGWLIYAPGSKQLVRVNLGSTTVAPTSARTYFAPWKTGGVGWAWSSTSTTAPASCGGSATYYLSNGQMVDAGNLPKVRFYPLPAVTAFPTATTANVTP